MEFRFTDLGRYREAARGWGLDFIQLDSGHLDATLTLVFSPNVTVVHTTLNRTFYQRGEAPAFGRTFGLFMRPTSEVKWLAGYFAENSLAVFPADRAYESRSSKSFDVLAITVEDSYLARTAEIMDKAGVVDRLPNSGHIYPCRPADLNALRLAARSLLDCPEGARNGSKYEFEITRLILAALSGRADEQWWPRPRRRELAFRAAMDFIKDQEGEPPDLATLCVATGVSERTLRYAFMDKLGIPPKTYLRTHHLNRAHHSLLTAEPGHETVSEIARRWGFWHMSQFALDYRDLYGERPSDTLRRVR